MESSKSLRATINWIMIIVAILCVSMVGSFWVVQEYLSFSAELLKQKDDYLSAKKTEIKTEVDRVIAYIDYKRTTTEQQLKESIKTRVYEAHAIANGIYNSHRGLRSDTEIQKMIKEALRPLIFNNGRGYFFIYDMQGNNVLLPFSPHLEGKNLWKLKDSKGKYTIQRTSKMIREKGEGFQRWHWYKPGETKLMSEKIGYSKHFEPYDWYIGTGEYIEDFEQDVQKETLEWINKIRFGEDGYIFVYNFNGTILAHFLKKNIGTNELKNTSDPYGIKIVGELIRMSQQKDGGFFEYEGKIRPSTGLRAKKISHSQSVKDWQWTVGAGVYVDSINTVLEVERKNQIEKIVRDIFFVFVIFLFSLAIMGVILRYISKKTTNHLTVFTNFFEQASTKSIKISDDAVHFSEFQMLARSANQMVDDRKSAEQELTKLRLYLLNIINSMPSVLVGVDSDGKVTQWNRQAEQVTGVSVAKAQSQPLAKVFPSLVNQMDRIQTSIRDRRVLRDLKAPHKHQDETRYEDVTIFPLVANGVEGAVIRVDDVTERVRLEDMMIQSEKMLSVGGLAAGMAHEINNPLSGILQSASVLENRLTGDLPANRKAAEAAGITMAAIQQYLELRKLPNMLENIRTSGKLAADIIKNMLSFARKSENIVSSHDLGSLLDQTVDLLNTDYDMKKHYDFKQIEIVRQYDDKAGLVSCEGSKLQQVFMNILKNGAEAMAEVTDAPAPPAFVLRVEGDGAWVRVEIEDNGPGMDKKTRQRIFEPFFTTKPTGKGTGLGLSVSYFIITEGHGGEMNVHATEGGGTRFVIRLPKIGKN